MDRPGEPCRTFSEDFPLRSCIYPRLPAEVTKLRTPTTCALEIKAVQWKENGKPKEETFKHDILLHPVNELTYSDLPAKARWNRGTTRLTRRTSRCRW